MPSRGTEEAASNNISRRQRFDMFPGNGLTFPSHLLTGVLRRFENRSLSVNLARSFQCLLGFSSVIVAAQERSAAAALFTREV